MALVQHRLDGLEQRCARRAKSVLQCPVGGEQMTIQRTMPGARRTLVQRPDQVPAQARQAHRLRRPGLGQRLEPGQHALLRQHQPRRPVAQGLRELRALPHSERLDALRHPLNQRLHVRGAVQLTGLDVDTLQRPAQRVHRRLELIESLDGLGTLAPRPPQGVFGLAPVRLGDATTRRAACVRGSETIEYVFAHELVAPDGAHAAVHVSGDSLVLRGGRIRSEATGGDALLDHPGTGFTDSMTRILHPVTRPHKLAPHIFWYSLDSMATARPPLPRAVNFTDHLG